MTKKEKSRIKREVEDFKKDYPNVELAGILPGEEGQYKMVFKPKLATIDAYDIAGADVPDDLKEKMKLNASVMYRDPLRHSDLDLANPEIVNEGPFKLYKRMKTYYRSTDVFASFVRTMVNLAISGFENDCEDLKIKEFYDNWCQDVDIYQVLEWIFQEFYITGFVRTYRVLGKYEPQTNTLSKVKNPPEPDLPKKEQAERKKRWSKGYIPLAYTVLNPLEIEIKGSVFLNQTRVVMKPNDEMKALINKEITTPLTDAEKTILDSIPSEIKTAIKSGRDIELDPDFVGEIDYRRMPNEKYPIPPFAPALEILDYKKELRKADYSTIDGITSEILVITIGDKDNPVTDEDDLRKVANLFNTVQKAFSVVWNHTLKVQRVEIQNIDKIFGPQKFAQAETDLSGAIGIPRAMLDGVMIGGTSKDALSLSTKAVIAELMYARRQVARWLLAEYKFIADVYGFDRYPSLRWNEKVLRDELAIMTVVQGLVDRRIISYYTAIKMLDLDPEFELKKLEEEFPLVKTGKIGIIGSPYQKGSGDSTQPTQKAPKGSPSEGRPKNKQAPTPAPSTPPGQTKEIIKKETKHVKEEIRRGALQELKQLSFDELEELEKLLKFAKAKRAQELVNLVDDIEAISEES